MRTIEEKQLKKLKKLLEYSDKYEISIQFWPKQVVVYIEKDDVELQDYGGDWEFAIESSIEYLNKITNNKKNKNEYRN